MIRGQNEFKMIKGSIGDYALHGKLLEALALIPNDRWNSKDARGNTLLHYACRGNNCHALAILIKYGLDVNARNDDGELPIHVASIFDVREVIPILCAANTRFRLNDNYMAMPFDLASTEVQVSLVENGFRTIGTRITSGEVYMSEANVAKCRKATITLLCIARRISLCKEVAYSVWSTRTDPAWIMDDIMPKKDLKRDDSAWEEFLRNAEWG